MTILKLSEVCEILGKIKQSFENKINNYNNQIKNTADEENPFKLS
jgi:hypothetical protein